MDPNSAMDIVLSQYSLLRNIFSHLPMSSLKMVSSVSRRFRDVSTVTRRDVDRYKPEALCWIGTREARKKYEHHALFASPNHQDMEKTFRERMSTMAIDPAVAIILTSGDIEASVDEDGHLVKSFIVNRDQMERCLPTHCQLLSLMTAGIVGMTQSQVHEIENAHGALRPIVASVFFPRMPDVDIIPIRLGECAEDIKRVNEDSSVETSSLAEKILLRSCPMEDYSKVKCVVLLTSRGELPHGTFFLQELGRRTKKKMALGGGVGFFPQLTGDDTNLVDLAHRVCFEDDDEEEGQRATVGLVFAGDGVEAASVILTTDLRTEKAITEKLSELKRAKLDEKNSCAFMFACCGRGQNFYKGKKNLESSVFQKLFPQTPLIGLFGGGEIGVDFIPNLIEQDSMKDPGATDRKKRAESEPWNSSELLHAYTTVFVFLSFKS